MNKKDFKKGFKNNQPLSRSNKRDPTINDIPEIRFDPHLGRSNIYEVQEILNKYVTIHLPSLKDCIATRKLKYAERPIFPTESINNGSANNINNASNINAGNKSTLQATSSRANNENNSTKSQQDDSVSDIDEDEESESDNEEQLSDPDIDDEEVEDETQQFPQQIDDLLNPRIPYDVRIRLYERRINEYERAKREQETHLSTLRTIVLDLIPADLLANIKRNKEYKISTKRLQSPIFHENRQKPGTLVDTKSLFDEQAIGSFKGEKSICNSRCLRKKRIRSSSTFIPQQTRKTETHC